jgi:hypothetical protein
MAGHPVERFRRTVVTRTLNLAAGTWKVTLKATLASGNSTSKSKNTTVSG